MSSVQAGPMEPASLYPSPNDRFGFCAVSNVGAHTIDNYDVGSLNAGWYVDFYTSTVPLRTSGLEYVQTVRVWDGYNPATLNETLGPVIDANLGSLWQIGNEPDRRGLQDDRTPAEYAVLYHDLYHFVKGRDPSSKVAIGGIVQPTPLRLLYLDMVWDEYQRRYGSPMPVDVWNIHNFILREDYTWGAGIPPGLDDYAHLGRLYGVQDHDDIEIFREQIYDFRRWMAEKGERNKPLVVSEYGVLMPASFGFRHARVRDFMLATFDFFLNTTDNELGYSADGNRLVQRWSWYSLNDDEYDPATGMGFNGNLFDRDSYAIEPLGQDYATYTAGLVVPYIDLDLGSLQVQPAATLFTSVPVTVTVTASVHNRGNQPAGDVMLQFWRGTPEEGGVPWGPVQLLGQVPARAAEPSVAETVLPALPNGVHVVYAQVWSQTGGVEPNEDNNLAWRAVAINPQRVFLPSLE